MRFTEPLSGAWRGTRAALSAVLAALVAACAPTRPPAPSAPPAPPPRPPVAQPPEAAPAAPRARNWEEYKRLAAQRLVQGNPDRTYLGVVPEPLLGIPILEVELEADGRVRSIKVEREPKPANAKHTTQLAVEAVRRAAPFPPVGHLPRPWKFTEVFLFDDLNRFKPRTLDD